MNEHFNRLINYLIYFTRQIFSRNNEEINKVPNICNDPYSKIIDNIYIGDYRIAGNLEELNKIGIKHIINSTNEYPNKFPENFNYLNLKLKDDIHQDLTNAFEESYSFLKKNKGDKTLIHCIGGFSRSVVLVMYYLMKEYNYTFNYALNYIVEKRKEININDGFKKQLLDAEKNLLGDKAEGEGKFNNYKNENDYNENNPLIDDTDIKIDS